MAENGRSPERTRKDNLQNPPFNNPSQRLYGPLTQISCYGIQ